MSLQVEIELPARQRRRLAYEGNSHWADRTTAYTLVEGSLAISGTT
jgi:hypothetical protein